MAANKSAVLLVAVAVAVAAALAAAFVVLDSPAEERRQRLDDQREKALTRISAGVEEFWKKKESLPTSLEELQAHQDWQGVPTDPVSDEPYVYRVTSASTYELCADFAAEAQGDDRDTTHAFRLRQIRGLFETHPAGEHCFDLDAPTLEASDN